MGRPRKASPPTQEREDREDDHARISNQDAAEPCNAPDGSWQMPDPGTTSGPFSESMLADDLPWDAFDMDIAHGPEDFADDLLTFGGPFNGVTADAAALP